MRCLEPWGTRAHFHLVRLTVRAPWRPLSHRALPPAEAQQSDDLFSLTGHTESVWAEAGYREAHPASPVGISQHEPPQPASAHPASPVGISSMDRRRSQARVSAQCRPNRPRKPAQQPKNSFHFPEPFQPSKFHIFPNSNPNPFKPVPKPI
jgi:hypothetical protein